MLHMAQVDQSIKTCFQTLTQVCAFTEKVLSINRENAVALQKNHYFVITASYEMKKNTG